MSALDPWSSRASRLLRAMLPSTVSRWGTNTISLPLAAIKGVMAAGVASRAYPPPARRNDRAEK